MSQKPKNPRGKRGTYTRVISRTTSESLRLVEPEKLSGNNNESHTPANLTLPPPQKPASSFVVTSVVHSRADGGTDSPEDESRSDDISRVTDLETPSCSEETYSKEVDEEGASMSFTESDQPPVPSEGHTVVTVPSVLPSTHIESTVTSLMDIQSVSAVPQQIQGSEQEKPVATYADDVFIAKCNRCIGRFQVVKVESIVPFHRGRWTCHDYLDNSKHAPEDGWVFYKERFVKKSELAEIKILEEQNISTIITSTVTTVTAPQPHCFEEVCQFKTYSTNILDNSCVTVPSNMQQIASYPTNQSQLAQALEYTISGQATISNQSLQYQASNQKYFPVVTTVQQQIFANQSAITSPSIENAPNIYFHPQTLLPTQPYVNQPEYYGGVPFSPQSFTSTHTTNINEMRQSTLENEKNRVFLQGQNVFVNQQQSLMTSTIASGTYSAPVQSQYQIAPQNQMFVSQSEPPSAQGPSVPMNPFVFPQVSPQISNQNLTQVPNPNIAQPTYLDSLRNLIQVNQNARMMPAEQYFPMQAGNNIIPSTISYQHNILQNAPVYQSTAMTTLTITSSVNSFVQTGQHYVSTTTTTTSVHTSPPIYQTAGVNTAQGSQRCNQMLPVYQSQTGVLNNMNQNVLTTETQTVHVPLQNVVNSHISASNIKPVPMQFVSLQENAPSILGQQVQGSVIHTPPQTPTTFPVQTMPGMPLQNLHVQASIMNTPPQTPIMDQPILESSTVLPSQHLASIPASGDSIWVHPFSSTPCILTNMCYQFLPVVAYAPVINSQLQRQRYNSTPTLSYSWPSSPTYCARENENVVEFSDSETNEIFAHVADYLDREKQNQRGGSIEHRETPDLTPVDNEDNEQYIVVVKKDKTSSLSIKETVAPPDPKKDSVTATPSVDTINNETPKSEPKIIINNLIAKSDNESLATTTENVITTKSLVSSEDTAIEVEENLVTVDSIIGSINDSFTQDNTVNADTCSINLDKKSNLVDSEGDTVIDTVRFCLDNIFQKTMEFVEIKLEKTLSKEKQNKHSKGSSISTLIDSDTGRVIIIGDKKSKTYIPPFSTSKSVHAESSNSDYIKSMTFINKSYSEELQVSESVTLPSEDFADTSITMASQPDWTFSSKIVQVNKTIDSSELNELPSPEDNLQKTSMELLISEESQERILQSCEDVLLSEHLEVASDSCDSQSDNTVIFRVTLLPDSNLNDTECDHSESSDLITEEEITEDVSPATPTQPESDRFVISLMSDDSDSFYLSSPEAVSAAVSPHNSVTCSCLEQINRVTTCASSVIDHKIEQAMDLVKTHLMNSMRAEVESLKARIAELMERIHQLELENDFLKANASPEVLIALNNGAARIQDTALSYDFMTPTTTQSATN